ncbi:uncharacterized protein Ecym_4636 [Eremothecium cymbalariae DBVPG|uniref:Ceramide glucosyltransferase n=1 Tax=Eremothecium cymbalariae (strain CBS 270.75 / DBVPG 7215 / KCTC 17166 / NRRL Y-17582) TaxID=931890 RepID=G8JSD7_ERECY|nr:hypothetical protein Ecym_4636 [Eremothecium cymbalariae DBVPG\
MSDGGESLNSMNFWGVLNLGICVILCLWYAVVLVMVFCGWYEILVNFDVSNPCNSGGHDECTSLGELECVSILRPCKGIDAAMQECLESCILQDYSGKIEVIFCVESIDDPCVPIIKDLLMKYPDHNIKLLVGSDSFGPNPKVNNLAKGYRSASHDIIWVLDSNVWCSPSTLRHSVISLTRSLDNGRRTRKKVILTHHIPLGVSLNPASTSGRLEEAFLFSSHAKFYVAFNKLSIAPCVNGKSNLYLRSSLNKAVDLIAEGNRASHPFHGREVIHCARQNSLKSGNFITHTHEEYMELKWSDGGFVEQTISGEMQQQHSHGIEFFSRYIGEDNMIGTALWNMLGGRTGMTGHCVIQPLVFDAQENGLQSYVDRRVRWLRVRRYMVVAATFLEPTTESIVIGIMGSYGIPRLLFRSFNPSVFGFFWFVAHMIIWCYMDRVQYNTLALTLMELKLPLSSKNHATDIPTFLPKNSHHREFYDWLYYWFARELLAFPIWIKAISGSVINWRNSPFRIKSDLTAESL